ncbi:LysR substrate-binding domain-containing protein [Palleronia sp. LCG004]|uniref:LysR substrate-binding domain-containing protein n=1 Tax=Palleronia sp. LCG004 TaxID=3079304 RepID=UPI0029423EEA|nr:LysR substrate-binding domain-containing protein [Palleronia sp. LCG004]WOI58163.1 LysR substrate-binding domain-containing protein [Palleronia sp. LCG004]
MKLFDRAGGGLVPTVEALSINEQLQPVFDTIDRIAQGSGAGGQPHAGKIGIVAPPTIAHRFLPPLIAEFARSNPDLHVVFDVLASDALMTGIAESRFDIGLTDTVPAHDGIRTERLISTSAVCLLPRGHRLTAREEIHAQDLADEPFISLSRRHSSRMVVDRLFDREGVPRKTIMEASTNVATAEFVRAGLGVALVNPFPIVGQLGDEVEVRPFLPEIPCSVNFLFAAARPPSAATRAFTLAVRHAIEAGGFGKRG